MTSTQSPDLPVVVHIDDEASLIEITRVALRPLPIRFLGIVRAEAGLETLRFVHPMLLLLDLVMPAADGWTLIGAIKSDAALRDIRIVVYSALSEQRHIARARAAGVDDFLTKPCSPDDLRRVVARMTGVSWPARGALAEPGAAGPRAAQPSSERALQTGSMGGIPQVVAQFVDSYLESEISLEVVTYLHQEPERYVTAATLARALRRQAGELEPALTCLVATDLVLTYPAEEGDVYMLNNRPQIKEAAHAFFAACEDRHVRVKAMYRIIRRRSS